MSDRDTALRRVQKLLSLATSPNEHEASAAAEKAQELMQKWKIEEAEVRPGNSTVTVESWVYANMTVTWRRDLAFSVARGFFCRCVHVPRSKDSQNKAWLNFVGRPEDIAVAKAVYEWLTKELERLAKASTKDRKAYLKNYPGIVAAVRAQLRNWHQSFLQGAVGRLADRLREGEERFEEEEKGCALVKVSNDEVNKAVEEAFAALEASPPAAEARDPRGWLAGDEAARTMAIQPPTEIGGGA